MGRDHHRWDLAGQGTNPNNLGPYFNGSVPDVGLPRASGGMAPSAGMFNKVSEGITDNKVRASDSHNIQRSGRGITLQARSKASGHPFMLVGAAKGYLCMSMGTVRNASDYRKFDIRQVFPAFKPPAAGDEMYSRGGEFNINIRNKADAYAVFGTDGELVYNSQGRYASRIFFGADGGEPAASGASELTDDYCLYFDLDVWGPILKYKKVSEVPSTGTIPVAYVFKSGLIMQIVKDDIVLPPVNRLPFQVSFFKEQEASDDWKFRVTPGLFNNQMPKYDDGKLLSNSEGKGTVGSGNYHDVYIKAEVSSGSPPYTYPKADGLKVLSAPTGTVNDTNDYGIIVISQVEFEVVGGKRRIAWMENFAQSNYQSKAYNVYQNNVQFYYWKI